MEGAPDGAGSARRRVSGALSGGPARGLPVGADCASPGRLPAHVEGVTIGILGVAYGVTVELDAPGPFDAELGVTGPGVLALVSGAGRLCVLEPDPTTSVPCSQRRDLLPRSVHDVVASASVLSGDRSRLSGALDAPA